MQRSDAKKISSGPYNSIFISMAVSLMIVVDIEATFHETLG